MDGIMNNNNNNNMDPFDEAALAGVPKNWPHMKFLCTRDVDIALKLLRAVDECKCTTELNANNSDYPKGNNWNRLYDHCFGGGSEGRGLLAGVVPKLASASKLKQKVTDIWAWLKKVSTDSTMVAKIDKELMQIARRQELEHEKVKADENVAADKQKDAHEVPQGQMKNYEAGLCFLPPGAKGTVGGGRRQHSTNLKTNQPAAYSFVNLTTVGEAGDESLSSTRSQRPKPARQPQSMGIILHTWRR